VSRFSGTWVKYQTDGNTCKEAPAEEEKDKYSISCLKNSDKVSKVSFKTLQS
jgi:hypothetical protein